MDAYEAIKIVMPRIQRLDPVHASKIVCYILMKERGEKEMIRLAFAPEALFTSYINQVKSGLGLLSPAPTEGSFSKPNVIIPNNGFHFSNPSNFTKPISYDEILNGSGNTELLSGQDQLPFLDDTMRDQIVSPSGRSDSLVFPYSEDMNPHPSYPFHRRSFSVNDAAFLSNLEEGGGGWRPCMYFARGFCKNGSSCKFVHSEGSETVEVGSPSGAGSSGFDELLRMKAIQQQQKLALISPGGQSGHHHPFHHSKYANFLTLNHRNDFSQMALRASESSSARQIYLTFPADSTFKEEDVFRYFSKFGPVKDVRIPYQQKRMFGFVTFFYPETVKQILAKGNPHFVCDSRVLVKPYKEKGKVADKKQQQQQYLDRGEYSTCLSPSGADSSDLADLPIGPRMLLNTQEMRRRKLEEMEFQHVLERQGQRIMNLQLMDMENQQYNSQFISGLSTSLPISSPIQQSHLLMSQKAIASPDATYTNIMQEFDNYAESAKSPVTMAADENFLERTESFAKHHRLDGSDNYLLKSNLDHALPDTLFATLGKSTAQHEDTLLYHNDMRLAITKTSSNNTDDQRSAALLPLHD